MLKKIQLKLQSEGTLNLPISSLLHGVLIQQLGKDYAEEMHEVGVRPYSQFFDESLNVWNIHLLNETAEREIGNSILNDNFTSFWLEKRACDIVIAEKKVFCKSYDQLLKEVYFSKCSRYITLKFLTPTAFKQKKNYVCYPDLRLIFQSIIQKHDAIQEKTKLQDEDMLNDIIDYTTIIKYHLRTKAFYLEGIKIQGFVGTLTLKIGGPQMLVNFVHFLISYAEYSGIGIKTAIGMGAIAIKEEWRKESGTAKEKFDYRESIS